MEGGKPWCLRRPSGFRNDGAERLLWDDARGLLGWGSGRSLIAASDAMVIRFLRRLMGSRPARNENLEAAKTSPQSGPDHRRAREALQQALTLLEAGRPDAAETFLRQALDLEHDLAEAHYRLGVVHEKRGELEDAADCYALALHFDKRHIEAHYALAALHKSQGRYAQAAAHYRGIVDLNPNDAAAHINLCFALFETADYQTARRHGERAVAIEPQLAEAHHNLGLVLRETGESARAVHHFKRALELKPRAEMAAGLAHAYRDLGRLDEAIESYDHALHLKPDLGDAAINRAYAYLLKGDYATGWTEYEGRFAATGTKERDFGLPRWNGEALQGKTILVHAEQGIGDEIMFASCLPDLIARADRVIIECSDRLELLFRRSFPQAIVHGGRKEDSTDWVARFTPVHCQLPIGSLPRWFRSDRAAFNRCGGYLRADPEAAGEFRRAIDAGRKRVIGISWRGGTPETRAHLRSIPLELFSPLLERDAVFVSVQHGAGTEEQKWPAALVRTFESVTHDLDRLAALISVLDLVVSVDNTNVQLAGALGRPVWALLSASPEWRYGTSGETMPWYPSAKLFRRADEGGWEPVMQKVVAAFATWAERSVAGGS